MFLSQSTEVVVKSPGSSYVGLYMGNYDDWKCTDPRDSEYDGEDEDPSSFEVEKDYSNED